MLDHSQIIDTVIRDYIGVLNRLPDPAGLNFWVGKIETGAITFDGLINVFADQLGSNGLYKNDPGATSSTIVNEQIAQDMYLFVLDRPEDTAGQNFWAHSGVTVGHLFNILTNTPEFLKISQPIVNGYHFQEAQGFDQPPGTGMTPGSVIPDARALSPDLFV